MSDEPPPELRALAATLFAAGRAERPGSALGRRLELIEPERVGALSPQRPHVLQQARARVPARSRVALWSAAAILFAGAAGVWLVSVPDVPIHMSPDRAASRTSAPPGERGEAAAPRAAVDASRAPRAIAPLSEAGPQGRSTAAGAAPPRVRAAAQPNSPALESPPTSAAAAAAAAPEPAPDAVPAVAVPADGVPAAEAPPLTLIAELDLLKRARAALRSGAGEQALELLDRRAHERSDNGLDAEATLLRIEALSALGRHAEASELAARFVRANPNSTLGDRAKSFLRGPDRNAP